MIKAPEKNYDKPAASEVANEEWFGSNVAANSSPERGAQDRFDLNAILSPTTPLATSGRKPLFRR